MNAIDPLSDLVRQLGADDEPTRLEARRALCNMDEDGVQTLVQGLAAAPEAAAAGWTEALGIVLVHKRWLHRFTEVDMGWKGWPAVLAEIQQAPFSTYAVCRQCFRLDQEIELTGCRVCHGAICKDHRRTIRYDYADGSRETVFLCSAACERKYRSQTYVYHM